MLVKLANRFERHAIIRINKRQVFNKKNRNNVSSIPIVDRNTCVSSRHYLSHCLKRNNFSFTKQIKTRIGNLPNTAGQLNCITWRTSKKGFDRTLKYIKRLLFNSKKNLKTAVVKKSSYSKSNKISTQAITQQTFSLLTETIKRLWGHISSKWLKRDNKSQ